MRACIAACLVVALGLAHSPGVRAADDHGHPHAGETADAGHAPAGPKIFPTSADTSLWSLAVFLIVLFLLTKYAWKPILEGLHKREATIQAAVDEAVRAKDEAAAMRADFDKQRSSANEQVRALLDDARRDAELTRDEMVAKAKAELAADRDRLRQEMETARDQTLEQLYKQSVELASLMSAKAVGRTLPAETHSALIDEAIADLKQLDPKGAALQTILGSKR